MQGQEVLETWSSIQTKLSCGCWPLDVPYVLGSTLQTLKRSRKTWLLDLQGLLSFFLETYKFSLPQVSDPLLIKKFAAKSL